MQQQNKISERIQALEQSTQLSQYASVRQRTAQSRQNAYTAQAIDSRLSVKGRAARFSQFDTGKPLEPLRQNSVSGGGQIIGNRIPRVSVGEGGAGVAGGVGGAQLGVQAHRSISAGPAGASVSNPGDHTSTHSPTASQRRRSEDIAVLNGSRLSIMSDQSSQSMPTWQSPAKVLGAEEEQRERETDRVETIGMDKVEEAAGLAIIDTKTSNQNQNQSRNHSCRRKPLPSFVVREREEHMDKEATFPNDTDNGWNYIATNKSKPSDSDAKAHAQKETELAQAEDFGPSIPLEERFNFISLTEPPAISKLEPKLIGNHSNDNSYDKIIPNKRPHNTSAAGDWRSPHKARLSTSADSIAGSTKSTFKSSMGRIFKGRMFRRRKTLEGLQINTSQSDIPPLPTSFSQTLPAVRSIEPMKIDLPTAEDIDQREENEKREERRSRERKEEMVRNRMVQEERLRKMKEAEQRRKQEKVRHEKIKEDETKQEKRNREKEIAIEDADWATAVIREYGE
ncbi:hypothetical protein E3P86_03430 [Wallemia ichthyophaga]|uniref:Uncharacterized protein n=1 Tax=Wallemia ichthyophaga TaxID=245174 RepID=A0A4V4M4L4_WALIC|nr:hypothetical protein E3P86_03430 [Wallemia ichthyophaga]